MKAKTKPTIPTNTTVVFVGIVGQGKGISMPVGNHRCGGIQSRAAKGILKGNGRKEGEIVIQHAKAR